MDRSNRAPADVVAEIDALITGHAGADSQIKDAMRVAPQGAPGLEADHPQTVTEVFGPVIDTFTLAEGIASGQFIQAPADDVRDIGFTVGVAFTRDAWEDTVAWADADTEETGLSQDQRTRLRDLLWMLRKTVACAPGATGFAFKVICVPRGKRYEPADYKDTEDEGPVAHLFAAINETGGLTVMLPHEV